MKRLVLAALLALAPALTSIPAQAQTDMQAMVDRATLALQDALQLKATDQPRVSLSHARAVLICPRVLKAGFFFGAAGGQCVLVARAANGTWSYPAFYAIGSASFGLQIGLQDSEIVMMIMTSRGLNAILDSHFKIGAGASVAIAMFGGGVQGDTTTAVGADILAFLISRGAYAGISLEGSVLNSLSEWNQSYYGQPLGPRQIVMQMQGRNPGAEPLREMLTRYGTPAPATAPTYAPPQARGPAPVYGQAPAYMQQPAYGNPQGYGRPPAPAYPSQGYAEAPVDLQSGAPIQQQNLPPPR